MDSTQFDVLAAAVIGFAIGAALVGIISYNSRKHNAKVADSEIALRREYEQYRQLVNEHFMKTADAIDHLTLSYQQMLKHLSRNARRLMDKNSLAAQLEKRRDTAVTLTYLVESEHETQEDDATSWQEKTRSACQPANSVAQSPVHKAAENAGLRLNHGVRQVAKVEQDSPNTAIESIKQHIKQSTQKD